MKLIGDIKLIRELVKEWKKDGLTVGLVPTMGYLHEGHKSLIDRAVRENDRVVVSIFVNPIQFGPNEDLESYPRNIENDCYLCENAGVSAVFNPNKEEMYFDDFCTSVNMIGLTENLCGISRPTHFSGVCTVVNKLFNIITPDNAYFGQKDAQQLAIIRRMVRDLNIDVNIVGCPIIREKDGLAKSSRNSYLNENERNKASILYKSLRIGKNALEKGERNSEKIIEIITRNIETEENVKIDYVKVVDNISMKDIKIIDRNILVAIAVYIGSTRLIDNFVFEI